MSATLSFNQQQWTKECCLLQFQAKANDYFYLSSKKTKTYYNTDYVNLLIAYSKHLYVLILDKCTEHLS